MSATLALQITLTLTNFTGEIGALHHADNGREDDAEDGSEVARCATALAALERC